MSFSTKCHGAIDLEFSDSLPPTCKLRPIWKLAYGYVHYLQYGNVKKVNTKAHFS